MDRKKNELTRKIIAIIRRMNFREKKILLAFLESFCRH